MTWFNKSRRAANSDDYETWFEGTVVPTLNTADVGDARSTTQITHGIGVRRLTPTELERLQGFPDGHTATRLQPNGQPKEQGDSVRARQLGNAVAVPVAAWIFDRITEQEAFDDDMSDIESMACDR